MSFSISAGSKELDVNVLRMDMLTGWMFENSLPSPFPGWNGGNFEEIPYEVGEPVWSKWVSIYEEKLQDTAPPFAEQFYSVLKEALGDKSGVRID